MTSRPVGPSDLTLPPTISVPIPLPPIPGR